MLRCIAIQLSSSEVALFMRSGSVCDVGRHDHSGKPRETWNMIINCLFSDHCVDGCTYSHIYVPHASSLTSLCRELQEVEAKERKLFEYEVGKGIDAISAPGPDPGPGRSSALAQQAHHTQSHQCIRRSPDNFGASQRQGQYGSRIMPANLHSRFRRVSHCWRSLWA